MIFDLEKRIDKLEHLRAEARRNYEAYEACMQAGKYKTAVSFQDEASYLYERCINVLKGLMRDCKH